MTEINVLFLFFLLSLKSRDAINMGNVLYKNQSVPFDLVYIFPTYYISGVIVSVFETSVEDRALVGSNRRL